jgi:hypothetical protein
MDETWGSAQTPHLAICSEIEIHRYIVWYLLSKSYPSVGSIRRECTDHIIVLGETHLRRILKFYATYYKAARTHRNKDSPVSRPVHRTGRIISHLILGGLHHQYSRT